MAILPGSTLGMLGGGQLGRMFVTAARTMGYEVIVLDPDPNSPAGGLASQHLASDYDDTEALDYLSRHCAAVTTEFENIPAVTLAYLAKSVPVHPSASALHIAQHRKQEKEFFREQGLSTADFVAIENDDDVESARDFSFPAILKTAMLGYDGKGQVVCLSFDELQSAFEQIGRKHCVLEQRIDLDCEVSVVLCRSLAGEVTCFPIAENSHANGRHSRCQHRTRGNISGTRRGSPRRRHAYRQRARLLRRARNRVFRIHRPAPAGQRDGAATPQFGSLYAGCLRNLSVRAAGAHGLRFAGRLLPPA
jgi:phosphoribosylaminoimidazole carboxylase (NCAIR synthetase)